MNLYLIGFRGTGKTSVGRQLALLTARAFIDLDERIGEQVGMTIDDFVRRHGWPSFRRQESAVLSDTALERDCVVATGGGIILDPQNVELMKNTGRLIWLRADARTIRNRIRADVHSAGMRPPLTGLGTLAEVEQVLEERNALYREAMDFSIDTERRSIGDIAGAIRSKITNYPGESPNGRLRPENG
jgi:shikimate kinase